MNKKILFFLILVFTAGLYWNIFNLKLIGSQWLKAPVLIKNNLSNFFSADSLLKIEESRWNAFGEDREDLLSKLYYNKGYYLIDRLFDYLTFLSPRFYFQAGDGTNFSPPRVEPIAGILFPFFVFGVLKLVKEKNKKILILTILLSFLAYMTGQKNFIFLFPIMIIYVYISSLSLQNKYAVMFFGFFSFYILCRVLFLIK